MKIFRKLFDTKVSTSYMFILFGVSALMLMGYFSYAWFTVQGVQQYSVVTGNLNGTVAIGSNSVAINGTGVITYTPSTDSDTITLIVTNTSDRTVKNSIYYYDLSDSSIKIGYTVDSPTIPEVTGVSVEKGGILTYNIKITGATGKQIKIGSSMGLNNSNLTLPVGTNAFEKLEPTGAESLIANANKEDLDYNTATDDQKNQMWKFSHDKTDQTDALTDYRYIGSSPNNYVTFNDEVWRIIGVFDIDDGTGKVEKRIKIIRDNAIGSYSWDNKNTSTGAESANGKNNWTDARLNYLLNEGHESESYGGSLYWNRKSGNCYKGSGNSTSSCDFTSTGLTMEAKAAIDNAKWYLGGTTSATGLVSNFYSYERGNTVFSRRDTSWIGKVGLIYPSDYGYATSGGSTTNRNTCLQTSLASWNNYSDCYNNDWLYKSSAMQWTINSKSDISYSTFRVQRSYLSTANSYSNHTARPTVYLKSSVKIASGTGEKSNPYILSYKIAATDKLLSKANDESLNYTNATTAQKQEMWSFTQKETTQLATTTDYRYIGSNPNNYVTFNDELWRIIGVFDVDDGTGKIEKRLKITKNKELDSLSWDYKADGSKSNDYTTSGIKKLLNGAYYNRTTSQFYSGSTTPISLDFTTTGLTATSRNMIEPAKWYLGGSGDDKTLTTLQFYSIERHNVTDNNHSVSWVGNVGLIYPSDYGYATSGGSSVSRQTCYSNALYTWNENSSIYNCRDNDWLIPYSTSSSSWTWKWTITPTYNSSDEYVYLIRSDGLVTRDYPSWQLSIFPTVYLKSTVGITSGSGTETNPYILSDE